MLKSTLKHSVETFEIEREGGETQAFNDVYY